MRDLIERLETLVEHPEVTPGVNRIVPIDAYMRSPRNDADGPAGQLSRKVSKKSGVYARRAKKKAGMRSSKPKPTERERENNAAKQVDVKRREAADKDRSGKRKKSLIRRAVDAIKNKVGDRKLRRLAAKLDEWILAESPTHNGMSAGRTVNLNFPVGTKPFRVGRKKAKGLKKTIVPRAIETGNDPGPNRDFKVE